MTRGTYGQYCGLSRAAEMIGERWGMLIVRDLLVSPKTVDELRAGLPRITAKLLETRLRELLHSGIVRRQEETPEDEEPVYELTAYGRAAEDVLLALSRWGAQALAAPKPEDIVTEDSLMVALRSTFQAQAASELVVSFELHVGEIVVSAVVDHGELAVHPGPLSGVDAVIDAGPLLQGMLTGEVTVAEALDSGKVTGDPELLSTFTELFQLSKLHTPVPA